MDEEYSTQCTHLLQTVSVVLVWIVCMVINFGTKAYICTGGQADDNI